jgi:AmmeMemoRadiSam system protein A
MSELSFEQRSILLDIARRSIEAHFREGDTDTAGLKVDDPELERLGAAFVTLTRGGRLRGCIGYSEPLYPLHDAVARCAVAAATQDYRFAPVTREELDELTISISTLTPLTRLDDVGGIEPGRHGLMIVDKEHRGLLLPQVAAERGWDRETFLQETCRKAGLADDAWKQDDVEIFVFEAQVFSDEEL